MKNDYLDQYRAHLPAADSRSDDNLLRTIDVLRSAPGSGPTRVLLPSLEIEALSRGLVDLEDEEVAA